MAGPGEASINLRNVLNGETKKEFFDIIQDVRPFNEVEPQVIKVVGFIKNDKDYQLYHTDYGAQTLRGEWSFFFFSVVLEEKNHNYRISSNSFRPRSVAALE